MLLRTQQDLPMTQIVFVSLLMTILFAVFFHVMCAESLTQTVIAFVLVMLFALMLSVVGISSIAFTGNEPVSGMTIFMIIVSAVVMGGAGMAGKTGIIAILMMAAFLCAALAVSSNFMSELKVAYITGATPKKMQQWQLVSIVLAGVVSVGVVFLMHHAYGFTGEGALAAPQANAMAAIVKPMMDGGDAPWPLYSTAAMTQRSTPSASARATRSPRASSRAAPSAVSSARSCTSRVSSLTSCSASSSTRWPSAQSSDPVISISKSIEIVVESQPGAVLRAAG